MPVTLACADEHGAPLPTTIHSLPDEILTSLIGLLDLRNALCLSRSSRKLHSSSQARIWRDVDLSLNHPIPEFNDYDGCEPGFKKAWTPGTAERRAPVSDDWEEHDQELGEKVGVIRKHAEGRTGHLIKAVRVVPTAAAGDMVAVLKAATHLRSLYISMPYLNDPQWQHELHHRDTIDFALLKGNLQFPHLTHLSISDSIVRYWELLPFPCNAMPDVTHLSAAMDLDESILDDFDIPPTSYKRDTKIRQLRLVFGDPDVALSTTSLFLDVIRKSPQLRQSSVLYDPDRSPDEEAVHSLLSATLGKCECLEDLLWNGKKEHMRDHLDSVAKSGDGRSYGRLRRLIYNDTDWHGLFEYTPMLPNLELLCFSREYSTSLPTPPDPPLETPHPTQTMLPGFADRLRGSPKLHTILDYSQSSVDDHFDYFRRIDGYERSGDHVVGRISSVRHGEDELLIARIALEYIQEGDETSMPPDEADRELGDDRIRYTARDGSSRVKVHRKLGGLTWLDYTDFGGLAVPMEVIGRMRDVEGASEADWSRRGIEVGKEAWRVLLDWKESVGSA